MSNLTSANFNPIDYGRFYSSFSIADTFSPGIIPIDGIRGFDRKTGWEIKKGKGAQGATLTLSTLPPAEGTIELNFWRADHFLEWGTFVELLKYNPTKKAKTGADAFDIGYPFLNDLGINSVVTQRISPVMHKGRNLYAVEIDFIEWIPPPPVSIVHTTNTSKPDNKAGTPGSPTDPIGDAKDIEIGLLSNKAANTPFG